ncbi:MULTISPECIES: DUF4142 domain-containing protein [Komagataeibacter]|uniref:DUF305 domain-containing protein n=2 Tax=Komagataeibacter TaxID=1434011 RepID=A0A318QUD2_9PROT|nr:MULTISPECIES: DUF4142 domain-containing protein [Komagataeibacter]GBR33560.1 hypothetical protein AA11826_1092 [Komagataeibacter oboediens DSM 11826]MBL7233836.1 DUF4142 domain-containing protein [Komagataeibacter oboediens]MBT0674813.1 DUF4142 domain-containing protein [Komagataeibacter oboediens]MBT0678639.1 DUF4142 domain-containing protein [Komagataeibacter oboediens]MBV0887698.1 DUF4142 domain-containing protein [Komagataeibacter oboediens]
MKQYAVWFLCASVSLLPVAAMARPAPAPAPAAATAAEPTLPPLTESDSTFAENVSALNTFEMTISKMATTQAKRPKLQEFAEKSLKMHTTNQTTLAAMTLKHGLELHKDMSPDEEQVANDLKTQNGGKFDRTYLDLEAQAASDALAMFQNEAESASDPELKAYASSTADTLQAHLKEAMKLGANKPSR